MKAVHPYLNFPGTAEAAFAFYREVFGGAFLTVMRYGESPMAAQVPAEHRDKLMHISLPLPCGTVLMASDWVDAFCGGQPLTVGSNVSLSLDVESRAEADRLFAALSAGGAVTMPLQDMFWNAYFGTCTDRFGINWMISHDLPKPV
jgi:PhnB protein